MKPSGYYANPRADVLPLLAPPLGRVLDVGCGEGMLAETLRERQATWISGVELHAPAARAAAGRLDEVVAGRAEEAIGRLAGPFDTILLLDVLEHLPEPEPFLARLRDVAASGARAVVSVPNARHWTLLRDLALRGTFGYAPSGHRDATHLRWLTRSDLVALLEGAGWAVEAVVHAPLQPVSRLAERLTRGLSAEFLVYQWLATARLRGSAPEAPPSPAGEAASPGG